MPKASADVIDCDDAVLFVVQVMDAVSNTMVTHGLSIKEVLWCFDRNGDQVSDDDDA